MTRLRIVIVVLSALLTLLLSVWGDELTARAHAELERSEPAANAVIPTVPVEVHLWFTQELFKRKGANVIEVYGPDGVKVDQDDTRIDDDDRKHALVSLKPGLAGGVYTVRWRNSSSEDGHQGSGEFSFTINPAASDPSIQSSPSITPSSVTTTAPPESTPTVAPEPATIPASPPQAAGGVPCLSGFLLGGLFLGVVAAGGRVRRLG